MTERGSRTPLLIQELALGTMQSLTIKEIQVWLTNARMYDLRCVFLHGLLEPTSRARVAVRLYPWESGEASHKPVQTERERMNNSTLGDSTEHSDTAMNSANTATQRWTRRTNSTQLRATRLEILECWRFLYSARENLWSRLLPVFSTHALQS